MGSYTQCPSPSVCTLSTPKMPRLCTVCVCCFRYEEGVGLTPQQKASMMGVVLLSDYMFFERVLMRSHTHQCPHRLVVCTWALVHAA